MLPNFDKSKRPLTSQISQTVFQGSDAALDEKTKYYPRQIISLYGREIVSVPRNAPLRRFEEFGIIPKSKYTLEVYLEVARLFNEGKSPDQIVEALKYEYPSLSEARISREFVKKAIKLVTAVLLPDMVRLVPTDGNWSLMIDGTVRAKYDDVLIIIAAVPLEEKPSPSIIPLMARFVPSENTKDILQLLYDLKPKLPSQPRSIISDFRVGLLEAVGEVFPNTIKQGCHYHMIEMIARIMVYPLIKQIMKKISGPINGINRWAHHCIYAKQSENSVIVAECLQKLCTSNHGKFGANFLQFCKKFQELSDWIHECGPILQSSRRYKELVDLIDTKSWRQLSPLFSQLEYVLAEFNKLRACLTSKYYKTQLTDEASTVDLFEFDNLIQSWIKLGAVKKKSEFHKRFGRAAEKLKLHHQLLVPAIVDDTLPRTTSILENLNGRIKRLLRKWNGSMKVHETFSWAAPLAAVSQSLAETDIYSNILHDQTGYDWIEKAQKLAKKSRRVRFLKQFSNSMANKTPKGLVGMMQYLVIADITH